MTFKKKAIISAVTLALVVAISVFSVVAVLAASNISVTTDVSVTYVSQVVSGHMTTSILEADQSTWADVALGEGTAAYPGTGNEKKANLDSSVSTSGSFAKMEVDLTEDNKYVYFRWVITNTAETAAFKVGLVYTDTHTGDTTDDKNIIVQVVVSNTEIAVASLATSFTETTPVPVTLVAGGDTTLVDASAATSQVFGTTQGTSGVNVKYIYAKVSINDLKEDAAFTGTFKWAFNSIANAE